MSIYYSHSYADPDTGDVVDVMVDNDDDDDGLRNAAPRPRRPTVVRQPYRRPSPPVQVRPRPQAPVYTGSPAPIVRYEPQAVVMSGEHISIRKGALLELIPAIGKIWASFLGMPAQPKATGNDLVDRDNAAAHRDALAQHAQNQTRILALSELASQAVKAFVR